MLEQKKTYGNPYHAHFSSNFQVVSAEKKFRQKLKRNVYTKIIPRTVFFLNERCAIDGLAIL